MTLKLYNTLSRRLETLEPIEPGVVRLYTCGPTVYDTAHIGNFRTFIFEDLLKRYLKYSGLKVRHVMNVTDVDDRTIERAAEEGQTLAELTGRYCAQFQQDLSALNILPADHLPRATEFIPQMVAGIQTLIDQGQAYTTDDGSVYFNISSYPEYGRLARLNPEQMVVGERVAADDYAKEEPRDFALWKGYKPSDRDSRWPAPWGEGRPGWHIECSIMSTHFLGEQLDIHCGGVDNIFPHHENELAQSRCLHAGPFVNLWLHSEHLIVDGRKMSKSLGNFYILPDLLEKGFSPEAVRYTLLSTHYRKKLNFTFDRLQESQQAINRLRELARRLEEVPAGHKGMAPAVPDAAVAAALDDDLNIAGALGAIFAWAHELFGLLDRERLSGASAGEGLAALGRYDEILGVVFFSPSTLDEEVTALIAEREAARQNEDWARADEIREQLQQRGILLEDTSTGTIWKRG
ncbi:MAG: cysteine--tRNA ligase [Candidatus Marinimicrobia bacterium]|nr:cysteine--tRNA ligase [Candidatus Neomarinimicrobiota bacterium]